MYWIKLSLILLHNQFNRNSLAFQTNTLGHGSQMQLRLSDIYSFPWGIFFFCQDYRIWPGLHLSKTFYHFSTNQILQCKQWYIHLILHMKCIAGCHNLFHSSFFRCFVEHCLHGCNSQNMPGTFETQGHLKLKKQALHFIHYLAVLYFFPLYIKNTAFLICHHHPVLSSSSCQNSQSISSAWRLVLWAFRPPPSAQGNVRHPQAFQTK